MTITRTTDNNDFLPDGKPNPNKGQVTEHDDGIVPLPNTPNNPYFGKKPMAGKDFWALVGQTLSAARFKRLVNDSHFLWVDKVMQNVDLVDPDDKGGQFLAIVGYLTTTNGDDAALLLEKAERDAIMAAWK